MVKHLELPQFEGHAKFNCEQMLTLAFAAQLQVVKKIIQTLALALVHGNVGAGEQFVAVWGVVGVDRNAQVDAHFDGTVPNGERRPHGGDQALGQRCNVFRLPDVFAHQGELVTTQTRHRGCAQNIPGTNFVDGIAAA